MSDDAKTLRFTGVADINYDDYSPEGECSYGYETTVLPGVTDFFGYAVRTYVYNTVDDVRYDDEILMTTESCWSGYSEYTVTNQWSEITLTVPVRGWEKTWESVGLFLTAIAEANPEAPHVY